MNLELHHLLHGFGIFIFKIHISFLCINMKQKDVGYVKQMQRFFNIQVMKSERERKELKFYDVIKENRFYRTIANYPWTFTTTKNNHCGRLNYRLKNVNSTM